MLRLFDQYQVCLRVDSIVSAASLLTAPVHQEASSGSSGPRYASRTEFATITGLSLSTVDRRLADKTLPFYQPAGPRTRVLIAINALELTSSVEVSTDNSETVVLASATQVGVKERLSGPLPHWMRPPTT